MIDFFTYALLVAPWVVIGGLPPTLAVLILLNL